MIREAYGVKGIKTHTSSLIMVWSILQVFNSVVLSPLVLTRSLVHQIVQQRLGDILWVHGPAFLLPQTFLQKRLCKPIKNFSINCYRIFQEFEHRPNWASQCSLCRVFLGPHKCFYKYIRWMVRECGTVLPWRRGIGRIR